jgi:hypothetical protein
MKLFIFLVHAFYAPPTEEEIFKIIADGGTYNLLQRGSNLKNGRNLMS